MTLIYILLICFVALEHFYFMILEMFLWTTPKVIRIFGFKSKALAEDTKVLAANQGLYNGFMSGVVILALVNNDVNTLNIFMIFIQYAVISVVIVSNN